MILGQFFFFFFKDRSPREDGPLIWEETITGVKYWEIIAPFLCEVQGDRLDPRPQIQSPCVVNIVTDSHKVKFLRDPVMAI